MLLIETLVLLFFVVNMFSRSANISPIPALIPSEQHAQTVIGDEKEFPPLNLPAEYFEPSEVSIGAGMYNVIPGEHAYRSYPSTVISLDTRLYSTIPTALPPIKSDKEIHTSDPDTDFMGNAKEQSIKKYGDLARRYAGNPTEGSYIYDVAYADLDKDGNKEQIVNWTEMGANVLGGKTIVIKNNKEIFSTNQSTFSILRPATDSNGFYLEWDDNHKMRDGCVVTRFVFENNEFKPIYEQKIRYIRVHSSN